MISTAVYAIVAKSPRLVDATNRLGVVVAEAYCLPGKAQDALDTATLWTRIVAIALGVIALIILGIGMFFSGRRHDGGETLKGLGWWIGGAALISAAAGVASIFLGAVSSNCKPIPA
ncbi:hypothetical protein [Clavibacter michiganensis]|uniref:hypothetical protein n=1 Tax=Clavibacter michiganensis TaxID=28447 RepID=UPI001430DB72|nr:hypothetical protein [Clavibacter michiganensis]MDO4144112.1 hypothetical protein [Clavibacter michiganensis]QIT13028.1 hypothetical protein GRD74_15700 [Clavibacter michiganensis subsp. michiganensis]QIT16156.1 hypothetical protein GRD61_15710 [Clavibacter michiganensis subsp. michiganensis]